MTHAPNRHAHTAAQALRSVNISFTPTPPPTTGFATTLQLHNVIPPCPVLFCNTDMSPRWGLHARDFTCTLTYHPDEYEHAANQPEHLGHQVLHATRERDGPDSVYEILLFLAFDNT